MRSNDKKKFHGKHWLKIASQTWNCTVHILVKRCPNAYCVCPYLEGSLCDFQERNANARALNDTQPSRHNETYHFVARVPLRLCSVYPPQPNGLSSTQFALIVSLSINEQTIVGLVVESWIFHQRFRYHPHYTHSAQQSDLHADIDYWDKCLFCYSNDL